MVDVGKKDITDRLAVAECLVKMSERTSEALFGGSLPKGDALASVRLAGIMGAKQTSSLIPLCHPISIDGIEVLVERSEGGARIEATVRTSGRTGVEMEALTAVSVAGLALYDMVKGTEREVEIGPIRLLFKGGGRSGEWKR
jgi:cyclic pyranopterin monophosphate synthase